MSFMIYLFGRRKGVLMKNDPLLYRTFRALISFLVKIIFRPTVINKENIPSQGAVIICGNHTKWLDPLLLVSTTNRTIHFMAKDSLHKGMKKCIFKGLGTIPVNRKIRDKDSLNKAIECLNNNYVIGIFPEGTINKTDDIIMPFKFGTVAMAGKTNAVIVPFSITGNYKAFRKSVKIEFDKPYKLRSNDLEKENKILMEKVEKMIMANKEETYER